MAMRSPMEGLKNAKIGTPLGPGRQKASGRGGGGRRRMGPFRKRKVESKDRKGT